MLVTLRIYVTSGGPLVLAVSNNGLETEKYGLLYSAPQRVTPIPKPPGRTERLRDWD